MPDPPSSHFGAASEDYNADLVSGIGGNEGDGGFRKEELAADAGCGNGGTEVQFGQPKLQAFEARLALGPGEREGFLRLGGFLNGRPNVRAEIMTGQGLGFRNGLDAHGINADGAAAKQPDPAFAIAVGEADVQTMPGQRARPLRAMGSFNDF